MASKDYLKLCEEAQKKKFKLLKAQEKQMLEDSYSQFETNFEDEE